MNFTVDPALIAEARSDSAALDRLIEALWPEVYRVVLGIVRDRNTAEDAAQNACAAIARSLPQLQSDAAFYGWMYRIAGRCAIAAAKSGALPVLQGARCNEDLDRAIDLRDALFRLPVAQRSAIVLHYYAGLSSAEVGAALGVPSATIRFHLMLARQRLRAMLSCSDVPVKEGLN